MTPSDVATRYFECVRAKDIDGWMALFAEDALYMLPDGSEFAGKEAIRAFQEKVFGSGSPFPTPLSLIASDNAIAAEVEARLPDGTTRRTTNVYHLDGEGRIARLSVYKQGW
jgi:ketosteroid isomerase-like protein